MHPNEAAKIESGHSFWSRNKSWGSLSCWEKTAPESLLSAGGSALSGQGCSTEVPGRCLSPRARTQRRTQQLCPTRGCSLGSERGIGVWLVLMAFCWVLGLPPAPKIFQHVWHANKALLGQSYNALVKYLVWKLFQYLKEQVKFCRSTSHNTIILYKGSIISWKPQEQTEAVSWHYIGCGI